MKLCCFAKIFLSFLAVLNVVFSESTASKFDLIDFYVDLDLLRSFMNYMRVLDSHNKYGILELKKSVESLIRAAYDKKVMKPYCKNPKMMKEVDDVFLAAYQRDTINPLIQNIKDLSNVRLWRLDTKFTRSTTFAKIKAECTIDESIKRVKAGKLAYDSVPHFNGYNRLIRPFVSAKMKIIISDHFTKQTGLIMPFDEIKAKYRFEPDRYLHKLDSFTKSHLSEWHIYYHLPQISFVKKDN